MESIEGKDSKQKYEAIALGASGEPAPKKSAQARIVMLLRKEGPMPARNILTAGFCAWMLAPSSKGLSIASMLIRTEKIINRMEKVAHQSHFSQHSKAVAQAAVRILPENKYLFDEFLEPLRRSRAQSVAFAQSVLKKKLKGAVKGAERAADLVRIRHFHVEKVEASPDSFKRPGLGLTRQVYLEVWKPARLTIESLQKLSERDFRPALAFTYAASTIATEGGLSLLRFIAEGHTTAQELEPYLPELIGRAIYVEKKLAWQKGAAYRIAGVKPISFSPPPFPPEVAVAVENRIKK